MSPDVTQSAVYKALGDFLTTVVPTGTEIVQGQGNRVPAPGSDSTIVMTEIRRQQMAQATHTYAPNPDDPPAVGSKSVARSTAIHIQLDVFGASSADTAQVITTLLRDAHAWDAMRTTGVFPLYCEDALQMPFIGGEQQFIQRWVVRAVLHAGPAVAVPQQFADNLITTLMEFH